MISSSQIQNQEGSVLCPLEERPKDTVSCLTWKQTLSDEAFACSSWDSTIRIYHLKNFHSSPSLSQALSVQTEHPCLSVAWKGRSHLVGGCIDGKVLLIDNQTGSLSSFGDNSGGHTDAVKSILHDNHKDLILSLSFDEKLKVWDFRQPDPITTISLLGKPYCADLQYGILAIGLNTGKVQLLNFGHPMNYQSPVLTCLSPHFYEGEHFTDLCLYFSRTGMGLATSSSCGRSCLTSLSQSPDGKIGDSRIYRFKPHISRSPGNNNLENAFPVNTIGMHPGREVLFTAGADGKFIFWDLAQKEKLASFSFQGVPVTKAKFSSSGHMVAYATGYDYSQGVQGLHKYPITVGVHFWEQHGGRVNPQR